MASYSMVELIEAKRDGRTLHPDEVRWLISAYTKDAIPDYQMSALLMAIVLNGMDFAELATWTEAMKYSGDIVDLSSIPLPKIDKHSTGGVGDKVSIPLAPMVAACGVAVPMMAGRGLGHTGGTIDKLESIPGFRSTLQSDTFRSIVSEHGFVFAGQSAKLAPADRRIYALRDASGTVPSIPLIASSIMSKKLACDVDGLVLDVKVGSGAFMKDLDQATALAEAIITVGATHDTPVTALITDMDQPLGRAVGNTNEVIESLEVLAGSGPDDLVELTLRLGSEMLLLARVASDPTEARDRLESVITSGAAMERFQAVVTEQGGDLQALLRGVHTESLNRHVLTADRGGYVERCDAHAVGVAAVRLGGGRQSMTDTIDHAVGIEIRAKRGQHVAPGDELAIIGYRDETRLAAALAALRTAWVIGDQQPSAGKLVLSELKASS